MKPRIFVSSTFYDLKHIRKELSEFIEKYDFEPALFEDGGVGYTPNSPLDESSYRSIEGSDMALLIINGHYGSAATGEKTETGDYVSITRREFDRGIERGVPHYVFIEKSVQAEYEIYISNVKEDGTCDVKFNSTKSNNVFEFIREIRKMGRIIPIIEFDKVADIKDFLRRQWAGLFKSYLMGLKEKKEIESLKNTVDNMKNLVDEMGKIMKVIGEKVLVDSESKEKFDRIIEEAEVKKVCEILSSTIGVLVYNEAPKQKIEQVKLLLMELSNVYYEQIEYEKGVELDTNAGRYRLYSKLMQQLEGYGMCLFKCENGAYLNMDMIHPLLQSAEKRKGIIGTLFANLYYDKIFQVTNAPFPHSTNP